MYNLGQGLIQKTIEETEEKYIAELAEKDVALSERDACIAAKDAALSEKDARIAELEALLAAQQKQNV